MEFINDSFLIKFEQSINEIGANGKLDRSSNCSGKREERIGITENSNSDLDSSDNFLTKKLFTEEFMCFANQDV